MKRFLFALAIPITLCSLARCPAKVVADELDTKQQGEQAKQIEALRAESLERAKDIRVTLAEDGSVVELNQSPLLRFGEPARGNKSGSMWVWGKRGRPLVIAEIYRNAGNNNVKWVHAIALTSTELVTADTGAGRWAPQQARLKLKTVADAPPPAEKAKVRLRQMKAIARQFKAHQFWKPDNSRYELRLLASPLHRYEDTDAGLLDGALFIFAHGTNPEIVMLVEARTNAEQVEPRAKPEWRLGFAPLGSAELHVTLKQRDFWMLPRAPGVVGKPADPYWLFMVPGDGVAGPKAADGDQ